MFTGIIQTLGTVLKAEKTGEAMTLDISLPAWAPAEGESIAINGVCLTVLPGPGFRLFVSAETLSKTNLGALTAGRRVNCERALRVGDSLSGHMVQGHVDGVGRIAALLPEAGSVRLDVEIPADFARFCLPKGSITVDGVSLTINEIRGQNVSINLIPHTLTHTIFQDSRVGDVVNLECDVLAKYVAKLISETSWQIPTPSSPAPSTT